MSEGLYSCVATICDVHIIIIVKPVITIKFNQFDFPSTPVLLSITVSGNYRNGARNSFLPFILAELLLGIACPCFVIFSASLCFVVLQFVTCGRLSIHQVIAVLLPGVSFEIDAQDPDTRYWVIVDTFYYRLQKPRREVQSERYHWFYTCDTSKSTLYLTLLISLSLLISVSWYADQTVHGRKTINSCNTSEINFDEYTCFSRIGLQYIDCSNNTEQRFLQCCKFGLSSASSSLIDSAVNTVLLYVTMVNIFKFVSVGVRILHLVPSKIWGGVILVLGILIVPISISWWLAVILLASSDVDVTRPVQLFMVSMYFIISGLFLLQSKWWLKITPTENHVVELMTLQHWKGQMNPTSPLRASTSVESISTVDTPIRDSALLELEDAKPASNYTSGGTVKILSASTSMESISTVDTPIRDLALVELEDASLHRTIHLVIR